VTTETQFHALVSQGFNRIPLMAQAFADLETPLSLYLKLTANAPHTFLLESVVGGERFGRYSFIGLPARTFLRSSGFGLDAKTEVVTDGSVVETSHANPLDFIAQYQQRFKVALQPGMPGFAGAWQATLVTTRCATSRKNWKPLAHPIPWGVLIFCSCSVKSWR